MHDSEMTFTTAPNLLTLLRIAFVPLIVFCLFGTGPVFHCTAGILFILASITDYLDGYLARKQHLETIYGKLMDPLADKFLVVSALIMLQYTGQIHPVIVILLICREMAITGLRALASAEGVVIGASLGAKWKTATQMIAIPCIMIGSTWEKSWLYTLGMFLLYLSLGISLWSAREYMVHFFKGFRAARSRKQNSKKAHRRFRLSARKLRKLRQKKKG